MRVPVLVSVSLVLFAAAWCIGNPPSAAPDEADHYYRALAAGGGDLRGRPPGREYAEFSARKVAEARANSDTSKANAYRWLLRSAREFTVPARLTFSAFGCAAGQPHRSWECLEKGHALPADANKPTAAAGTYPPYLYVPPGLVMRATDDGESALRAGRLVSAGISVALLAAAAFLLWSSAAGAVSLIGLMVAVTPMVLFLGSVLSPSGPEVAASVCFTAALIRLGRPSPASGWVWLALGAGGSVLALSRPLGPFLVAGITLAFLCLVGPRRLLAGVRWSGAAIAASAAVVAAAGAGLFWQAAYGVGLPQSLSENLRAVPSSVKQLPSVARQAVGNFGALDSPLPVPGYVAWLLALAAVLIAAVVVSNRRDRLGLGLLVVGVLGAVVALSSLVRSGFAMQARYVLPLLVIVPLWAGELLCRRAQRVQDPRLGLLTVGVGVVVPLVQGAAWYANGRRVAVGIDGSWLFPFDADWEPPTGWIPWMIVVGAATAIYMYAVIVAARTPSRTDQKEPALTTVR